MIDIISNKVFCVKKPTKSDIFIVCTLLLYRVLLDIVYIQYVFPKFSYYHFNLDYDIGFFMLSFAFVLIFAGFVPGLLRKKRMTDLVIALLIIMYFIPYTTLLSLCSHEFGYSIFVFSYCLLLVFFNKIITFNKIKIKFSGHKLADSKFFVALIVFCGFVVIIVSGIYTGFRISFDLSEYYEYRAAARENAIPEILRYLYNWSIVGLDVGLAYCLINKKRVLSVFVIFANLLAFSYNGKKSVLFIVIVIVFVSLAFKDKYLKKIPLAFFGLTFLGLVEVIVRGGESFISKHFVRRMLFIPPFMGTLYFDFFSSHELDYLRASVLRRFGFVSPYTNIPRYIGQVYFADVGIMAMNANTGLCGDAFSNFGYWSLLIVPLVIVITFKIIEVCSRNVDYKIKVVVSIWLAYSFVSGAYFTLLLTNGVIFLGILMWTLSSGVNDQDNMAMHDSIKKTNGRR